ncbi:unnamed protein product [Prorocentrum cordatum]|uniref:Uncharacterized protein n=1 Tax=Prorocentrum cordatum TaxID=2364126 RepID=A0ABN9TQG7_9DINO|nr:unnamed protein product [Polarella glacialis]
MDNYATRKKCRGCGAPAPRRATTFKQDKDKYQKARQENDTATPHSLQLTQARIAKEKAEKEVSSIQDEVQQFEQQLANARERLAKKQEQFSIGFLEAVQKRYDKAVDGSGVSPVEYQQLFAHLGKVMANAKEDLGATVAESTSDQDVTGPSLDKVNKIGSSKVEFLKGPVKSKRSGGSRSAPAWPSTQSSGRGVPDAAHNQKKYDKLTVWTFNGSGWGTIEEKLSENVHGALQRYAVQGHHLADDKWPAVRRAMKAQGCQVGGAAAVSTTPAAGEAGSSAGAAVAVPRCAGMTCMYGQDKWGISPKGSPGRAAAAWASAGKGVVIASMYLWTAEGMSYRNRELASHVVGQLVLAEVDSLNIAKACVIAPNAACGTCRHAHGNSEIDYFIVSDSVKAQVEGARAQEEWPSAPRKPVGATIKPKVVERRVRVLGKLKPLPELQIGCAPTPPSYQQAVGQAIWWRWLSRPLRNLQGACARLHATTERWGKRVRGAKEQERRAQRDKLQGLYQEAATKSKEADQQLTKEMRAKWAEDLEAAAAGSAGGLRKLSKPVAVRRSRRADSTAKSAGPLAAAEFALKEWKAAWRTDDPMQQQERPWEIEAREQLGDFTGEVEKTLVLPVHMGNALSFMIPKTFTADRENQGSWDCTSFGNAAGDAAWGVLLSHEMDDPDVQDEYTVATITAVLDLVKALGGVGLFVLWGAGEQLKFHTGVLAVVCSYFAMARRPIVAESVPSETSTVATIIAGSKFSVSFVKMVIQSTVDGLAVERPVAKWRMYVDDLCVRLRRQQQRVVEEFTETLDACFEGIDKLGLEFSVGTAGKGAVMASTRMVRKAAAKEMQKRGLPVVRARPYLGVDLIANGSAAKSKSKKRFSGMLSRAKRLVNLKGGGRKMQRGTTLVYKCGRKRSVLCGCKCLVMPDQQLRLLRREAGRALPGGRGAMSPTLQVAVAQGGATLEVAEAPIVQWARAVWHAELIPSIYTEGAVIMSLKRADWTWPAWHTMRTKDGHVFNLMEVCPMDVAAMMQRDIQTKLWEGWTKAPEHSSLEPAPCIAPAVSQFKAHGFPGRAKSAAKKVFIGGIWATLKLCECNIVPADICLGCGNAAGAPRRGLCRCEALRQQRLEAQADWQHVAEQQEGSLLWARGLARSPEADWRFVGAGEGQCQGAVLEGDDNVFAGGIV